MPATHVTIDKRFRGPPQSGNGGYSCGIMARQINGPAIATLFAPPPLDRPLQILERDNDVFLRDGDVEIGKATAAPLVLETPPAPTFTQAEAAVAGYVGFDHHPFPGCFVCGPERNEGDGLRLFPGATSDGQLVTTPWVPDTSLTAADGLIAEEFVWAALDCPSYFGLREAGLVALLGRMHAEIIERPQPSSELIVSGWRITHSGRKYSAGSALFSADGTLLAKALAIWIELRND